MSSISSATGALVTTETWPGSYGFQIDRPAMAAMDKEKASDAHYSNLLDKLFCDVNKWFSVRFVIHSPPTGSPIPIEELNIRAMVVFTSTDDLTSPVIRCPNHKSPSDPINKNVTDPDQLEHVLWTNSQAEYERNESSGRLSTKVK